MGRKGIDLTGKRFAMLVAIRQVDNEKDKNHSFWECQCDCGNRIIVRKDTLVKGYPKNCGCSLVENGQQKHGYSYTNIYGILQGMKDRCYNKNNHAYHLYGGRGIKVCDEWLKSTEAFIKWSYENGYVDGKPRSEQSIDRIDVNGDYCPENCRWVDKDIQNYNKRCTRKVVINGQEKTLLDLHNEYGISIVVLRSRYQRYIKGKCTIDELICKGKIINKPQQIVIEVNGEKHNLTEWENITGISRKTISNRYRNGARSYDELFKKSH